MEIEYTAKDFLRAAYHSGRWTTKTQEETRWEDVESSAPDFPTENWEWAYWIGKDWVGVKYAMTWLKSQGEGCEIIWDDDDDTFVILTNYDAREKRD
jgi:hypothetical protein